MADKAVANRFDLRAALANGLPEEDSHAIAMQIVAQILAADSEEEVFAKAGTVSSRDLLNTELELRDVGFRNSAIEEGAPVYAILDVIDIETGEVKVVNTSSPRIMAQALRAKELGALPKRVYITEVAEAKKGQSAPLGLERIPTH